MKTIVSISKMEDCIKVKNDRGIEWTFPDTMTACDALVLVMSRTMLVWFDEKAAFEDTFEIEMSVKPTE